MNWDIGTDCDDQQRSPLYIRQNSQMACHPSIKFSNPTSSIKHARLPPSPPSPTLPLFHQLIPPLSNATKKLLLLQEPTAILLPIRSELFGERRVARCMRGPVVCGLEVKGRRCQLPGCGEGVERGERTFSIVVIFLPFDAATSAAFMDSRLCRGLRRRGALVGFLGVGADEEGVVIVGNAVGAGDSPD